MERLTKIIDGGVVFPRELVGVTLTPDDDYMHKLLIRLAAYEDTGLEPEKVAEYQHLCETYVEAGLDSKFVQACIDATKRGVTIEQILELGLPNDPLTLEELREMDGEPVWVELIGIKRPSAWYLLNLRDKEAVNKRGGFVSLIYYGDTWLAYRRRLEEGIL